VTAVDAGVDDGDAHAFALGLAIALVPDRGSLDPVDSPGSLLGRRGGGRKAGRAARRASRLGSAGAASIFSQFA